MNAHDHVSDWGPESASQPEAARALPTVDAAIERLIAATPLRRPSAALDSRIASLVAAPSRPWWMSALPLAAAAGFILAVGFVAGSWNAQVRLTGGGGTSTTAASGTPSSNFVLRDSSVRPVALARPTTIDLGDDGAVVQAIPSLWLRTDRYVDPETGVMIERTVPEMNTLVGPPAAD